MPAPKIFGPSELKAIAVALGDTGEGLTQSEIAHLLAQCNLPDPGPNSPKWTRLYNAFADNQNFLKSNAAILQLIRLAVQPARHTRSRDGFEALRRNLNVALAFCSL